MSTNGRARESFRFGVFELSRSTATLLRNGIPVKLPPQPAQVLLLLVERAGQVVTREEIQQLTWADNTIVDFEVGINRCIRRIRSALLDDADAPRYLETVPKVGYRFIAPIAVEEIAPIAGAVPEAQVPEPVPEPIEPAAVPALSKTGSRGKRIAVGIAALCVAGIAAIIWLAERADKEPADLHTVPLAVALGDQYTPTFSPDGRQVAFTWDGEAEDNFDIYVKLVNSSSPPLRLTTSKDIDYSPAWSPDGEWIAFCRGTDDGDGAIWMVPALGGAERKIVDVNLRGSPSNRALAWTPDSKRLIVADPAPGQEHLSLQIVNVNTGTRTLLTHPDVAQEDMNPAVSPDGRFVAFTRDVGRGISRILVVPIEGGPEQSVSIPSGHVYNARPAWTPDGTRIAFVSNAGGESRIWLSRFGSRRAPEELAGLGDGLVDLSISATGQLGLVLQSEDSNLYALDVAAAAQHVATAPRRILASTRIEESPAVRPDGKQIAFASNRSGYEEIWTARIDGSDAMQITYLQNPVTGSPDWSPDGRRIVFDSRVGDRPQLYVTSADGGRAEPICCSKGLSTVPHWSPDDGQIYFSSDRTGRMEIWRTAAEGGTPVQVTRNGGFAPVPSPDGSSLYYAADNAPVTSLWRQEIGSGKRTEIASGVLRRSYAPASNGAYYFSGSTSDQQSLLYWFDWQSHQSTLLFKTDRRIGNGVALGPDARVLYFTQLDISNRQLLLVRNFWK